MKKIIALLLALVMVFALCACGKTDSVSGDKTVVGLVVAGAFGDRSFYDSSKEGTDRLAKDFGVQVSTIECNNENHDIQMKNAAEKANIVVCVGWEFYNIETIAPEYPNVHWIWIDNATSAPVENVLNITYAQNEGSFLAGYIAAAMSDSGVVGAVGGEDSDTINDFIVGYKQGAEYYAAEKGGSVKVETNYSNDYDDPAKGKECAKALHDLGADVIFQIASKAGDGVFEAAQEGGFCHNAYKGEALRQETDGRIFVGNFDKCSAELPLADLAAYIRRYFKKTEGTAAGISAMLERYGRHCPLSERDMILLQGMLLYPEKFLRLINEYYNRRRTCVSPAMRERLAAAAKEELNGVRLKSIIAGGC